MPNILAKVLTKPEFEAGEQGLCQGQTLDYGRTTHTYRGFGWSVYNTSSKLAIDIEVNGEKYEVWLDGFFKKTIGSLHKNVRALIEQTTPETIEVEVAYGQKGTKYYKATQAALHAWLIRFWEAAFSADNMRALRTFGSRFFGYDRSGYNYFVHNEMKKEADRLQLLFTDQVSELRCR